MSLDAYITRETIDDAPAWTCEDCGRDAESCRCEFCSVCAGPHLSTVCPDVPVCILCEKQVEELSRNGWCPSCIAADLRDSEPVGFDLEREYERLGLDGYSPDGTDRSAA